MEKPKVLVGYPVGQSVHKDFCQSLLGLVEFERADPSPDYEMLKPEYSSSLYVFENRNILVEMMLEKGCEWFMMFDSDIAVEPTALRLLMETAAKCQAQVVFGVYSNVMLPSADEPNDGGVLVCDMIFREMEDGQYQSVVPPNDVRPFLVDAASCGIQLTHRSVFEAIEYPWFWTSLMLPTGKDKWQIVNEDFDFCRKARLKGFQLWVDPRVEGRHYKTIPLLPSSFRRFVERARAVEGEMRRL